MSGKETNNGVKPVKFYARGVGKHTEHIPVWDKNGNPLFRQDKYGRDVIDKQGNPVAIVKKIAFDTKIANPKLGSYCEHISTDKYDIAHFRKTCADGSTPVCTEEDFEKSINKAAYEMKQKFEESENKRIEAEKALEDVAARAKSKIDQLEKEVTDLKKKGK